MANTVMSTKNTFEEGLVMDFAPDNTQSSILTSALNATLLTFNGNEMTLQNDMGNGRVETAYLPEGYVPVGTCEFGDIIYVVSYNPLTNKSQIGCFPSPERNISSDEISPIQQSVNYTEFQYLQNGVPTGELKSTSVKKIVYANNMNPGDKYIISSTGLDPTISDYGNKNHIYGGFPKLTKIHVIAIEDSGKINYLDNTVKWYNNDFFLYGDTLSVDNADLDSYRSKISSYYSIFQSKVSGKLALLIELERIDSFNCSYNIYTQEIPSSEEVNVTNKKYDIYFNVSWNTSDNNINPSQIVITSSEWPNAEDGLIPYDTYSDDGTIVTKTKVVPDYNWIKGSAHYGSVLSRTYNPEDAISYEQFINDYEYNKVISTFIQNARQDIQNDDGTIINISSDPNSYPTKVSIVYENNRPKTDGSMTYYYINPQHYDAITSTYNFYLQDGKEVPCKQQLISDDIINNFFRKDVSKLVIDDLEIPSKTTINNVDYYNNISKFVWNYEIAPAMPYGVLQDLAIKGTIDFSKVGSGLIELSEWRYYNDGNIVTLKWGLDAYPEDNKNISKIVFEFYDNQGIAASYVISDKSSYSGSFTEIIQLGTEASNPKMQIVSSNNEPILHKGDGPYELSEEFDNKEDLLDLLKSGVYVAIDKNDSDANIIQYNQLGEDLSQYYFYINDAGYLYPNLVYYVKINIFYGNVDSYGNVVGMHDKIVKERFLWTNTLMNEYYYNNRDYLNIIPQLNLILDSQFISNSYFQAPNPELVDKSVINTDDVLSDPIQIIQQSLGTSTQYITTAQEDTPNINLSIIPTLENGYNTFQFDENQLPNINYKIALVDNRIDTSDVSVEFSKQNNISNALDYIGPNPSMMPDLQDSFSLTLKNKELAEDTWSQEYYLADGTKKSFTNSSYYNVNAREAVIYNNSTGLELLLEGKMISKIAGTVYENTNVDAVIYKPAIQSLDDLEQYNIITDDNYFYFNNSLVIGQSGNEISAMRIGQASSSTAGDFLLPQESECPQEDSAARIDIGTKASTYDLDIGDYGILVFFTMGSDDDYEHSGGLNFGDEHRDGQIDFRTTTLKAKTINAEWRTKWRKYGNGGVLSDDREGTNNTFILRRLLRDGENYYGSSPVWTDHRSWCSLQAFIAKNDEGKYILFNNFCTSDPRVDSVTQRFPSSLTTDPNTFAQMLVSMLAKIYYRSSETTLSQIPRITNIVTCNNYTETWKQDIVIKIEYLSDSTKYLLSMSGINYNTYITQLMGRTGTQIQNTSNIDINLDVQKIFTVQFEYSLPYNIEQLEGIYNGDRVNYYVQGDITGDFAGKFVAEIPFSGEIGILQDGQLTNRNNYTGSFPLLNKSQYVVYTNPGGNVSINKDIINGLRIVDNTVRIRYYSSSNATSIIYFIGGDTDHSGACVNGQKADSSTYMNLQKNALFFTDNMFKIDV